MPDVYLHPQFLDSLAKLSKEDQSRVRMTLRAVLNGHETGGLRRHKVGNFVSLSPSMSLRLLAWPSANGALLMAHIDHHDAAYSWARRHDVLPDGQGRPIALIELAEQEEPAYQRTASNLPEIRSALLGAGFPDTLAAFLGSLPSETEVLEVLEDLAPEFQEAALEILSTTQTPQLTADLPSDIFVVDNNEILEWALRLPADRWRLFLHPRQRYAIEIPSDQHLLLRGGPGTGKTVTLLHRFARLLRLADATGARKPALVALNRATRQVLLEYMRRLGINNIDELILEARQLPIRSKQVEDRLEEYSCILIDEAQDLPLRNLSALLSALQGGARLPGLFLSYDINQAIINPSGDALNRLEKLCDCLTLTYCYRATSQIADYALDVIRQLHSGYSGKDYQHEHEIASTRDGLTAKYTAALRGPNVMVHGIGSEQDIVSAAVQEVRAMRAEYPEDKAVAVIVASDDSSDLRERIIDALIDVELSIDVRTPEEVKGYEFFAGVVIDILKYDTAGADTVSRSRYRALSGLYVAVSRFRDRLTCLVLSPASPLNSETYSKEVSRWPR